MLKEIKSPIKVAVMGCEVNGPGEAAMTDIGITGGGKGNNMLYLSGIQNEKVLTEDIVNKDISKSEIRRLIKSNAIKIDIINQQ